MNPRELTYESGSSYLYLLSSCWWDTYPSEKYDFVSWDDDIPNIYIYIYTQYIYIYGNS